MNRRNPPKRTNSNTPGLPSRSINLVPSQAAKSNLDRGPIYTYIYTHIYIHIRHFQRRLSPIKVHIRVPCTYTSISKGFVSMGTFSRHSCSKFTLRISHWLPSASRDRASRAPEDYNSINTFLFATLTLFLFPSTCVTFSFLRHATLLAW